MTQANRKQVQGTCHCGRIRFTLNALPERVTICNCSICSRYSAVWGYYQRRDVALEIADDAATAYQWNDRVINFIHCRFCGCMTHYEDVEKTPESRFAANFRMTPAAIWENIPVRYFDGADTFEEML